MQYSKINIQNIRIKRILLFITFAFYVFALALVSGCGERLESSRYYYTPAWIRDAKILVVGATESKYKDIFGSQLRSNYNEYLITIYQTGTGESSVLYDVTSDPPYYMSCSPNKDYVAYMGDLRTGYYGKIMIRSLSPEAFTGMREVILNFDPKIKSFDWSSDGNKIVYATSQEIRIRDWNDYLGTTDKLIVAQTGVGAVAWKYGNRIAFSYLSGSDNLLSLINSDGSGRKDIAAGASVSYPQISSANTNEVYGISTTTYAKVDVSAVSPARTVIKSGFNGLHPSISPDGSKVAYSKSGEDSGIYLLDLTAGTETKIK